MDQPSVCTHATPTSRAPAARAVDPRPLTERYQEFLGFLEKRVGRRDVAEDLLQDTLARALERLDELRESDALVPWFYRALRNATTDYYRRRGASARALEGFARELEASEAPDEATARAVCGCVAELTAGLKPEYADVLRRVELEGVAVKDYARAAGITASNAGVRVFRAREALRRELLACCGGCASEAGCGDCDCTHG